MIHNDPMKEVPGVYTRAALVAFVKDVLGEVKRAEGGTTHLPIRPGTEGTAGLEIMFVLHGMEIVGTYVVPIPEAMLALADNHTRNPYDRLEARVRVTQAQPWLDPVAVPTETGKDT